MNRRTDWPVVAVWAAILFALATLWVVLLAAVVGVLTR